jgi:carbon starvation protein
VALRRGEAINALWIVVAAVAIYLVAYRYYSLFIANNVMQLDPRRATPAVVNNDGLDYVPTNKHILFGHHFAAIAGAGPLVGPVLAAQMGYLPGTLWLIAGVVLAGAVQDFMVLFLSTRRNGRSLGDMVREEMGRIPGTIALFGCFLIMIIILAVLALIVVKALAESPWGIFTVMATIPIAMFMASTCATSARAASAKSRLSACCCCWARSGWAGRLLLIRSGPRPSPLPGSRSPGC